MGVDYYACTACGDTFPDCGSYMTCSEDMGGCGRMFCGDKCGKPQRTNHDRVPTWKEHSAMSEAERDALVVTCIDCRGELASDQNLLFFALKLLGKTREQLTAEYVAAPHEN